VEVAEHFIGPPATEQANDVSIHLGHQKSHGARRAKAFRGDVQRGEAHKMGTNEGNGGPKGRSNVGRENVVPAAGVEVGSKGLVSWGIMGAEMKNAAGSGNNGAEVGMARTTKANHFPADAAFLGVKFERDKVGIEEVSLRGSLQMEGATSNFEGDIAEAEGGGLSWADGVFTGAKQEEETQRDHVGYSMVASEVGCKSNGDGLRDDGDWNWFNASGGRIAFGVRAKLSLEAEVDVVMDVEAWVWGPHTEERLRNSAYGVFHCASADRSAADFTVSVAVGIYLK
jgi:hypothetical protein